LETLSVGVVVLLTLAAMFAVPKKDGVLKWIILAYTIAWAIVLNKAPDLWTVALLGFIQNVAFTFVSRGRNSGSLGYHLVASIFSNGIYAALLFVSIDQVTQAKANPGTFLAVYTLATMSGSIFAHWMALKMEKGKGKSVQEDKFGALARRVTALEAKRPVCERLIERFLPDGRTVRVWVDIDTDVANNTGFKLDGLLKDPTCAEADSAELARQFGERLLANAVQVGSGKAGGFVYYPSWP
jgi:hypothetical protein